MTNFGLALSILVALAMCPTIHAQGKPSVYGEGEIARGEHISQLSVFIINAGTNEVEFKTGVLDLGGDVPEGQVAGGATGLKVIPRLSFKTDPLVSKQVPGTVVNFQAPVFTNTAQSRARRPQVFAIAPGKRRLYYSFKMPTEYVRSEFHSGEISRRTESGYGSGSKEDALWERPDTGYGPGYVSAIPIIRVIEVSENKTNLRKDDDASR